MYLRTHPEVAYSRMKNRNKVEEKRVPYSYIQLVHQEHESWLLQGKHGSLDAPLLVLDANAPQNEMPLIYEQNRGQILGIDDQLILSKPWTDF